MALDHHARVANQMDRTEEGDVHQDAPAAPHGVRRRLTRRRLFTATAIVLAFVVGLVIGRLGTSSAEASATAADEQRQAAEDAETELRATLTEVSSDRKTARSEADRLAAELQTVQAELDTVASDLEDAESETADARADAEAAAKRADEADEKATEAARKKVEEENADQKAQLDERAAELDDREAALDERAGALTTAEEEAERSTFGNGTWEVGVDILPGKYKSDGGDPCYWAKLEIGDNEIIDNDLGEGPKVVVIDDGILFESQRCAEWRLVD